MTGRERCDEDCGRGPVGEDCPPHPPEPSPKYVPSGQTMAVMGWVPEKGDPGHEAGKSRSPKRDELEVLRFRLGRVRDLASTPPNPFFEGAWRTALLEILEMPAPSVQKKQCLACDSVIEDWPEHYRRHQEQGVLPGHRLVFEDEPLVNVEGESWTGCGECDVSFPCSGGAARCLRLSPMDPWSSLNDAIDLVVDLGGALDEGIAARLFGKNQRVMQGLSLRSRRWLSEQATAKTQREGRAEAERQRVVANGIHPGVDGVSFWKIWPNVLQSPKGEALFLADLRKLLGTIDARLVGAIQDEADRDQVLNSFTEADLCEELRERSRASQRVRETLGPAVPREGTTSEERKVLAELSRAEIAPGCHRGIHCCAKFLDSARENYVCQAELARRAAEASPVEWKCGACRDTKRWNTGIDCPVCVGEPKRVPGVRRGVPCNHLVADAGLELLPCPRCRTAWCLSSTGAFWVRCNCPTQSQASSLLVEALRLWNDFIASLPAIAEGEGGEPCP